jgi:2-oxoisovalerate dehydrogenase E2 component (dihydrolipoyl transacylase)
MGFHVTMPEMGEGVIEGTLVKWLINVGDTIQEGDAIFEIETDKVTVEVNAEASGTVQEIIASVGDVVNVGETLAIIDDGSADEAPSSRVESAPAETLVQQTPMDEGHEPSIRSSPVVARMAKEHDLDLSQITGTGRDGRITKRDVEAYLAEQSTSETLPQPTPIKQIAPQVKVDSDEGEIQPLTGMRRSIAEHMVMSKHTSPHATTFFEFDYQAVAEHRAKNKSVFAKDGVKLTYMPYLVMAVAEALKKHPLVNSSWTDDGILYRKAIHLGMAVAVPTGLLVPVIRDADQLNLLGLARAINDLAERGRMNKLKPDELKGGTFTVTNHGASGSLMGAPIINQPQAGILGVGMIEKRVKVIADSMGGDMIAIRPCAYVSFSFDHRILDGATADAFVMDIKQRIETWS